MLIAPVFHEGQALYSQPSCVASMISPFYR